MKDSALVLLLIICCLLTTGCGGGDEGQDIAKVSSCEALNSIQKSTKKIVSGQSCQLPKSSVVKIILLDEEDNQRICSGLVLSPNKILSAWHCFDEFVFSAFIEIDNQSYTVESVKLHPNAREDGTLITNDIAIITIAAVIESSPVTILSVDNLEQTEDLFISGFGSDGLNLNSSGVLRAGKMTVDSVDQNFIRANFIEGSQNTCEGDSGGPAFVVRDNRLVLAGITSTGTIQNCSVGDQSIFVKLSNQNVLDFIRQEVPEVRLSD